MTITKIFNVTKNDISNSRLSREMLNCVRSFEGTIFIKKNGRKVQITSLISILGLGIELGDELQFTCYCNSEIMANRFFSDIGELLID